MRRFAVCGSLFVAVGLVASGCGSSSGSFGSTEQRAVEDIDSMQQLPDGTFDVKCHDGRFLEHVTADQVRANHVCDPLNRQVCADKLTAMLSAPIVPPLQIAGLNLAGVSNPKGLTSTEADPDACATAGSYASNGQREIVFGSNDVAIDYNMESKVITYVTVGESYKGKIQFKSRPGSAYGDHTYELAIGSIHRDGADWAPILNDNTNTHDVNELFDAIMATFMPETAAVENCWTSGACLFLPDSGEGHSIIGVRPARFYFEVSLATKKIDTFYFTHPEGRPDCSTPVAALEQMQTASIDQVGMAIGGVRLRPKAPSTAVGVTWQEADAIACGGVQVPSPDPAYSAIQWGTQGELLLEYNKTNNFGYELIARAGYKGTISGSDDAKNDYEIGIGAITKNGKPYGVGIDLANNAAALTEIINAISFTGATYPDCLTNGQCSVTPDDGNGHSLFSIAGFPASSGSKMEVVLTKGTSTPVEIHAIWPKAAAN